MKRWIIDINCDVGEGVGNEAEIFPFISSCNIACGGHAGDVETMTQIVQLAQQHDVKIGAHPSYPDRVNFGRQVMDISKKELQKSIQKQLEDFDTILAEEQVKLHHIKAHGALYNQTAKDKDLAKTYLEAIQKYKTRTLLYIPYGSAIAEIALRQGFTIWYEAFGDRNYNSDLSLVNRKQDDALIEEPEQVLRHILPIIKEGHVKAVSGEFVKIEAKTLCIHGDTPSALEILMYLSQELSKHEVQLLQ
ncbi:5-oxoprolinase subunit PxpA [Muricauda sp. CAU 1633]|uniref:5-oxoprolinase subunit PxpA n=1 Tax=Allomuricauda sp. CAU 1633 TaxID=2816036 RepID=UPI001A8C9ED4|nr:5-oxoprolinase subunit PxpA [Muricauda sp. CAU 1633]MBO0323083.1 5-oxoprolinase subunit PxpA [Muricauda sp. CAU 1633]